MPSSAQAIAAYIHAKDGNRPHLLRAAFTDNARLRMVIQTDAISFPAESAGRDAIALTLVSQFNQTYENIYTMCIGTPPPADARQFHCDWLVVMSQKLDGAVRIGCGRYDWTFDAAARVTGLTITIRTMSTLDAGLQRPVLDWVAQLPYPWCSLEAAGAATGAPDCVRPVLALLRQPES